jgi:hypothetical protein
MKIDAKLILIMALIGLVVSLILFRGCGNFNHSSGDIDVYHVYDSIERVIKSELPPPDTIIEINEKEVIKWLPSARVVDTIYIKGETRFIYNDAPIDTAAILTHYLTQAVTYTDTIRDSSLQAVISDVIFRNQIKERSFNYKILRPIETKFIDNRDRFQLIASFQAGGGISYANTPQSIYAGADLGLKFKSGTYVSVGYMAGTSHFVTIRAGQVIRLRKR